MTIFKNRSTIAVVREKVSPRLDRVKRKTCAIAKKRAEKKCRGRHDGTRVVVHSRNDIPQKVMRDVRHGVPETKQPRRAGAPMYE